MSRVEVAHVAAFHNPAGGGFVASLRSMAARCDGVAFVCPQSARAFPWFERLAAAGIRMVPADNALDAARRIAALRPAIVHAHFGKWATAAALGARLAQARCFWHLHSGAPTSAGLRALARRAKYTTVGRTVEQFICVSPDLVEYLRGFGVDPRRIVTIPNGVDMTYFRKPAAEERLAARALLSAHGKRPVLLFFGRDHGVKGADRLARALEYVNSAPRVLLVAASQRTRELLKRADVIDAGTLTDVRTAFWAADALAMPSRVETLPYTLLEARSTGLPAVASRLPGIVEALGADPATQLIDADDPRATARAIDAAIALGRTEIHPDLARAISLERWSQRIVEVYASA